MKEGHRPEKKANMITKNEWRIMKSLIKKDESTTAIGIGSHGEVRSGQSL